MIALSEPVMQLLRLYTTFCCAVRVPLLPFLAFPHLNLARYFYSCLTPTAIATLPDIV